MAVSRNIARISGATGALSLVSAQVAGRGRGERPR